MNRSMSPPENYTHIKGWFPWVDRVLFSRLLDSQQDVRGDLVELGAYLGKSAVVIGAHLRLGERFVVVDLFGSEAALGADREDQDNLHELRLSYGSLTREQFEYNYRSVRGELPVIVQGLSSGVTSHVPPDSVRFLHIDASHLYEQVLEDARNAKLILGPGGIVVFDDFRSPHTPGVAAAVWESVLHGGLIPFAITGQKLYGVFDDPQPYLEATRAFATKDQRFVLAQSRVAEHAILRLKQRPRPASTEPKVVPAALASDAPMDSASRPSPAPQRSTNPALAAPKPSSPDALPTPNSGKVVTWALRELCPPILARWIDKRRRGRASSQ